jgi:UDP-N-acetylglucosamine 2-epimerase (non-hydrolysing)
LRTNTERPVTVDCGTNVMVGNDLPKLRMELLKIVDGNAKPSRIPPLWDGKASERIADVLQTVLV